MTADDVHTVAIAAIGEAQLHDGTRIGTNSKSKIAAMVAVLRKADLHPSVTEAVEAVRAHYASSDDVVTGEAILAQVRRGRLRKHREEAFGDDVEPQLTEDELAAERQAIRSWACPQCGAEGGKPCTSSVSGLPLRRGFHHGRARAAYSAGGAA